MYLVVVYLGYSLVSLQNLTGSVSWNTNMLSDVAWDSLQYGSFIPRTEQGGREVGKEEEIKKKRKRRRSRRRRKRRGRGRSKSSIWPDTRRAVGN